jgi:hypothetical protein
LNCITFPLTPALSLGERVNHSPVSFENPRLRLFDALRKFEGGRSGSFSPGEKVRMRGKGIADNPERNYFEH